MNDPAADRELEDAAERLVRGQAARPARPGSASDPRAHQVAAALAGSRSASTGVPARVRRRLERIVAAELAPGAGAASDPGAASNHRPAGTFSRRQWLAGAGAALAGGVAGAALGELLPRTPAARRLPAAVTLEPTAGVWRAVAPAAAVRAGHPFPFIAGAVTGVLVRDPAGAVMALSAICTHLGCRVSWATADQAFVCPCHGARFSASGRFQGAPWGADYPGGLPPLPRLRSRINPLGTVEVLSAD